MMRAATILVLAVCCACGGGGAPLPADAGGSTLTAQELLQSCVATDLSDLSDLLDTILDLASAGTDAPVAQFDILAGILAGGIVPWTLDLDGDGQPDLGGTVFFANANGDVTIPIDLGDLITSGIPENPLDLIADLPEGTALNITWSFDGLLTQGLNASSGSGDFEITFADGTVSGASGSATITSGDCSFDFDFDDIGLADFQQGSYPQTEAGFALAAGSNRVTGSVAFDGSGIAEFHASLDGGPEQVVRFDITNGTVLP